MFKSSWFFKVEGNFPSEEYQNIEYLASKIFLLVQFNDLYVAKHKRTGIYISDFQGHCDIDDHNFLSNLHLGRVHSLSSRNLFLGAH